MTDRLSLTNALAGANIDRAKAERIATEIYDAIHDNVATKGDLHEFEQRLETRFAQIEVRFTRIERQIDRMVTRLGGGAVVLLGLLFAVLHLWPPHG